MTGVGTPSAAEPSAIEVEPGVVEIDHRFRGSRGVIASYLLTGGDDLALVETGPASTTDTLLAGIRAAGFDPQRITRILVTHIHLDHAGAAGVLVRQLPRAHVYVHPLGAPHLIDPSKLLASATRIYGDMMKPLWGDVLPVPAERLTVLADGATVTAGGRVLRAIDTPGHANHHYAFHDEASGALFAGDVAGVRLDDIRYVRPPTPPPELELDRWRESIVKLRALALRRLYLTHFGGHDDVEWHLDELMTRLFRWAGWVGALLERGLEPDAISGSLLAMERESLTGDPTGGQLARRLEEAGNVRMSVDGFVRYFRKRRSS